MTSCTDINNIHQMASYSSLLPLLMPFMCSPLFFHTKL